MMWLESYRKSVELVESLGHCAYEVCKLDGLYHVTKDIEGDSEETYESKSQALNVAASLNRQLARRIA